MKRALKIRLYPTVKQETLMLKHIGSMRYIYNWALNKNIEHFKTTGSKYSTNDLGKMLTLLKKEKETNWLSEISHATLKEALRDLNKAYNHFFDVQKQGVKYTKSKIAKSIKTNTPLTVYDLKGHPKFKKKNKDSKTFYSRYDNIYFNKDVVNLEKIGKVKYKSNYKVDLTKITNFSNPRITYTDRVWILIFAIEAEIEETKLNDFTLGIDLGIKMLAITNIDELDIKNINKTRLVKNLEKKLKRLQRQISMKYEQNKTKDENSKDKFNKTKNIIKQETKLRKLQAKLKNIRLNHIHQATSKMVKAKPRKVVMEDLAVINLIKNKHLSKAIQNQGWSIFIMQMKYKCAKYGIEFVQADKFYPSSKMCSHCGTIKKDLKLKDRVYKCSCGNTIDRDKNASYNLAKYTA